MNLALAKKLAVLALLLAILALPFAAFAEDGAEVYKSAKPACSMCHGTDGKKMTGTKEFSSPEVQKMSDAELTTAINKGKPPKMPAYEGKLSADQVKALVAYVRTFKK